MKKFLSIVFVVLMMLTGMTTVVFADEIAPGEGSATGDVVVNVDKDAEGSIVYHVEIVWGTLVFTYDASKWNTETYTYEGSYSNEGKSTVQVINHSNAPVGISAQFGTSDTITTDGVTATLTNNVFDLASAADEGQATENTAKLQLTGEPKTDRVEVGTITVTISTK